jgi:2-iminobutanoate/2-iminopropanoate deaminase
MSKVVIKDRKGLSRPSAPYARVVRAGNLVFTSGSSATRRTATSSRGTSRRSSQLLENTRLALAALGAKPADVVQVTLYMLDIRQKPLLDKLRDQFFGPDWPAGVAVGVAALGAPDFVVEMDAVAGVN